MAQEYEQAGDFRRALLTLEQVVQFYPHNLEAKRRLAGIYERSGQKQALALWQEIVRLEPRDPQNLLGYAGSALRFGEAETTRVMLDRLQQSGQTGPGYYRLAAGVALFQRDDVALEANLAELARLQPADLRLQLNLALTRLRHPDGPGVEEARNTLIALARHDTLRMRVVAELFNDIARRWPRPTAERGAAFQHLIRELVPAQGPRLAPPEIGDPVEQLLTFAMLQPAPAPEDVVALLNLMILNGRAPAAFEWLNTLPATIRRAPPVLAISADEALRAADWSRLGQLLREGAWGPVPPGAVTLALAARERHDQATPAAARTAWTRVIESVQGSLPGQRMLLRLTEAWGWSEERRLVLQGVTRDFPRENWAWQQLISYAFSQGDSGGLCQLYLRWCRAQPGDTGLQVQAAIINLLLQQRAAPPSSTTAEWLRLQPGQAGPVVAHALALRQERQTAEALRLLETLPQAAFAEPRFALVYGVLLAESGRAQESEGMLNRATANRLLPDELLLAEQAHARNQARLTFSRDK